MGYNIDAFQHGLFNTNLRDLGRLHNLSSAYSADQTTSYLELGWHTPSDHFGVLSFTGFALDRAHHVH